MSGNDAKSSPCHTLLPFLGFFCLDSDILCYTASETIPCMRRFRRLLDMQLLLTLLLFFSLLCKAVIESETAIICSLLPSNSIAHKKRSRTKRHRQVLQHLETNRQCKTDAATLQGKAHVRHSMSHGGSRCDHRRRLANQGCTKNIRAFIFS